MNWLHIGDAPGSGPLPTPAEYFPLIRLLEHQRGSSTCAHTCLCRFRLFLDLPRYSTFPNFLQLCRKRGAGSTHGLCSTLIKSPTATTPFHPTQPLPSSFILASRTALISSPTLLNLRGVFFSENINLELAWNTRARSGKLNNLFFLLPLILQDHLRANKMDVFTYLYVPASQQDVKECCLK